MIPLASVINVCRSLFHANARPSPPRLHSVIDYWAARDPNRGKKFTILLLLASNSSIVVQKREERFVVFSGIRMVKLEEEEEEDR